MAEEIEIPKGAEVEIELPEPESVVDETPAAGPAQVDEKLEDERWERLIELQKMQSEKLDQHLSQVGETLSDVVRQNSEKWDAVLDTLKRLIPPEPANEPADVTPGEPPAVEPTGRRSKYARHGRR